MSIQILPNVITYDYAKVASLFRKAIEFVGHFATFFFFFITFSFFLILTDDFSHETLTKRGCILVVIPA